MRQRLAIWFFCRVLRWRGRRCRRPCAGASRRRPPHRRRATGRCSRRPAADAQPPHRAGTRRTATALPRRPSPPSRPRRSSTNGTTPIPFRMRKQPVHLLAQAAAAFWLLFLIWVKSADWVNRDTQIFNLGYGKWNPIMFFPFFAVLLLFAFPYLSSASRISGSRSACLLVCYLATFMPYVLTRNKAVAVAPESVHARLVPLRDSPSSPAKSASRSRPSARPSTKKARPSI